MKKGIFSCTLCIMIFFALCVPAQVQQTKKVSRIGYVSSGTAASESSRSEAIKLALRELGYIEGQNITIEYRYAEGQRDRRPDLLADLVRLKLDAIVIAGGDAWIQEAKKATKTIPIVITGGGSDPVEIGHVESLARPGGNITGITTLSSELGGKRLELLKEAVPKLVRVAVLYDPAAQISVLELKESVPVAARALGLTVRSWEVRAVDGFEKVFAAINKERADGLYILTGSSFIRSNVRRIAEFALKSRLPSVYGTREYVDSGGLMSYGADIADSYRRVAYFIDKILKGANPADLPIEQPTKFEFIINLKTAKQIGLTIQPNVLARADRIIR